MYYSVIPILLGTNPYSWILNAILVAFIVLYELNIFFNYFVATFSVAGSTKEWPKPWNPPPISSKAKAGAWADKHSGDRAGEDGAVEPGFGAGAAAGAVGTDGYCPPRHPTRYEPPFHESNGIL